MEVTSMSIPETSTLLKRSQMPKLGGSVAGFVVLIVILCFIIIISITAIVLLLRDRDNSDMELQKNQRPDSATYVSPFEDEAGSQPTSWLHRAYQRLPFTRTGSTDRVPSINVPQPPSRSESLARSAEELRNDPKTEDGLKPPQQYHYKQKSPADRLGVRTSISTSSNFRRLSTSTPTSSVRFDMGGVRDIPPFERERFVPSPAATLPTIHTQMSSRASSPISVPSSPHGRPHIISQEIPSPTTPASTRQEQDYMRYSILSSSPSPTPPTFEGGTKFLEAF